MPHSTDPISSADIGASTATDPPSTEQVTGSSSDKGKAKVVEEDLPSRKRSRRQMEEDRLGEEAAKRLYDDQQAELARFHEVKTRQVKLEADKAKQARMDMDAQVPSVSFDKPSEVVSADISLAPPSVETPAPSTTTHEPEVPRADPSSPHSAIYIPSRRAKRMAKMHASTSSDEKKDLDLDAVDDSFLEAGDAEDWPEGSYNVLVRWEVSNNGQTNTIYRLDQSSMQITFLQEILHLVDKQDLLTLYDLVTKYYSNHTPEGAGLYLLGDLQVLIDSGSSTGAGYAVWNNNHKWKVLSWRFFPVPYAHVLETTTGLRVAIFIDQEYPLTVALMEKMLIHHLEIPPEPVGNAKLFVESLVHLFKSRIRAHRAK